MSDYLNGLYSNKALTAGIGYNDGANNGFWRVQPRDRKGKWIEMGAEILAMFKHKGKTFSAIGHAAGSTGKPDEARIVFQGYGAQGLPDGVYGIKSGNAELIQARIPDEYLRAQGIDPNADVHGVSVGERMDSDIPEVSTLERADITPQDLALIKDGTSTPEGKQMGDFKNSPEGEKVAELPSAAAATASPMRLMNRDYIGKDDWKYMERKPALKIGLLNPDAADSEINKAIADAMAGKAANIDDIIQAVKDEGSKKGGKKKKDGEPSASDLEQGAVDENGNPIDETDLFGDTQGADLYDNEFNRPIKQTWNMAPDEVNIGDYVKQADGSIAKVTDINSDEDGNYHFDLEDETGPAGTLTRHYSENMKVVDLAEPGDTSAPGNAKNNGGENTPEAPSTPATPATPQAPAEEPSAPEAPDTAKHIKAEDVEVGDDMYTTNGQTHMGTVTKIRKSSLERGKLEARLTDSDGRDRGWWPLGDETLINKNPNNSAAADEAKKAEDAKKEAERKAAEEASQQAKDEAAKAAKDAADKAKDPRTPEGLDYIRQLLNEGGSEFFKDALDVLNDPKLSDEERLVALAKAVSVPGKTLDHASGGREKARIAQSKTMKRLRDAGVKIPTQEELRKYYDSKFGKPEDKGGEAAPTPTPEAPAAPEAPTGKQASGKPTNSNDDSSVFNVPGREDHGGDIGRDPDFDLERARDRKIPFAKNEDGSPVYRTDSDGNIMLDSKGRPIPAEDRTAILAAVLEDNKNAVVDDKGNVVFFRKTYKGADGSNMKYEVLIHKNTGGKTGLSVRFTNLDTGAVEHFLHHDERDSYTGLMGKLNGPEKLIDILEGVDKDGNAVERKAATRGFNTEGLTDPRQRADYFRQQKRLLTLEETAKKYLDGQAEVINTSLGAGGKAYGTKRQSEIQSIYDAIKNGDRAAIDERLRAMAGHFPLDQESLKQLRAVIRSELRAKAGISEKDLGLFVDAFSAHITRTLNNSEKRDIPYKSSDTRAVKPGMIVEWKNNVGEVSRGRVVELMDRAYAANGSEYQDNAVVEFLDKDGKLVRVTHLTTKNMTISADQKDTTLSEYKPWVTGVDLRQRRGLVQFRDDLAARAAEQAEESVQGGPVDDLMPGHILYGKDGSVMGHVVDMQPIQAASGKRGFSILYVDANGEDKVINVAAGEVRSPKA